MKESSDTSIKEFARQMIKNIKSDSSLDQITEAKDSNINVGTLNHPEFMQKAIDKEKKSSGNNRPTSSNFHNKLKSAYN